MRRRPAMTREQAFASAFVAVRLSSRASALSLYKRMGDGDIERNSDRSIHALSRLMYARGKHANAAHPR